MLVAAAEKMGIAPRGGHTVAAHGLEAVVQGEEIVAQLVAVRVGETVETTVEDGGQVVLVVLDQGTVAEFDLVDRAAAVAVVVHYNHLVQVVEQFADSATPDLAVYPGIETEQDLVVIESSAEPVVAVVETGKDIGMEEGSGYEEVKTGFVVAAYFAETRYHCTLQPVVGVAQLPDHTGVGTGRLIVPQLQMHKLAAVETQLVDTTSVGLHKCIPVYLAVGAQSIQLCRGLYLRVLENYTPPGADKSLVSGNLGGTVMPPALLGFDMMGVPVDAFDQPEGTVEEEFLVLILGEGVVCS